ncbi:MAG: PEP-CTERM sorting domain-containing protein [Microcystis aeruginosa W13-18]|nr:PEP-CTERM sorting domain-containing protein [Microcystis aeruginosa W13-18]NCR37662.1 PEP-CTERM sorting domain-containing protein [Microcystis aeruginosa S11-05]NCR51165.1 PEP-CTERM sorting domain-containing protein [Microcystis aeruginosa S11-01]NCR59948.1 PEP-CTERM sorting domain-containing protein [Microcystis aeruginosa LL13-06]
MKITHKLLLSSCLLLGVTVAPSQVLAGPFVPQGPFVQPAPGSGIPGPKNVPGKEYSDRFDKDTQEPPVLDPEQNIYWDGNGGRQDAFDYSGSRAGDTVTAREVDALANHGDALFWDVIANQAALLFSTGSTTLLLPGDSRAAVYNASPDYNQLGIHEKSVLVEPIGGGTGFWATPPQIDQAGVNDLDGLEVWGGLADPTPNDADMYSLLGDPLINGIRTSVWYYNGGVSTSYLNAAQIAAAINRPDIVNLADIIDLDGLMVWDGGNIGQWDNSDAILFSVMPIDANLDGIITPNINGGDIDGGEIWSWQFGQPLAQFLNHGGHLWDTAFNVRQATGAVNENIDALEAVAVPEPSTFLSLLTLGSLGAASTLKRKLKSSKSDEN